MKTYTIKEHLAIWAFSIGFIALVVVTVMVAIPETNREKYKAETPIIRTDEQKLTEHLMGLMIQQNDIRDLRIRQEKSLTETYTMEDEILVEVEDTLEAIRMYQGI